MFRLIAILIAIAALTLTSGTALADSGSYMQDDGPSCFWNSFGSMATINCSGYSRRAGDFVSWSCDYTFFGSSYSYTCRSITNGATWSGSR